MEVFCRRWLDHPHVRVTRFLVSSPCKVKPAGNYRGLKGAAAEAAAKKKEERRKIINRRRQGSWIQPNASIAMQKADKTAFSNRDWNPAESWYIIDVDGNAGPPRAYSAASAGHPSLDVTYDEGHHHSSMTAEFAEFKHAASKQRGDEPVNMENPYKKPKTQCLLCKNDIVPNYKNTRLLSQFTSQFSGMPYPKHVTNLCDWQNSKLRMEIIKAQKSCFMPTIMKLPYYIYDPMLFDPFNPKRGF